MYEDAGLTTCDFEELRKMANISRNLTAWLNTHYKAQAFRFSAYVVKMPDSDSWAFNVKADKIPIVTMTYVTGSYLPKTEEAESMNELLALAAKVSTQFDAQMAFLRKEISEKIAQEKAVGNG
jgi:hypothetical protein